MKHLNIRHLLMTVICALMVACAQVGLPTPETANERIAVAQASVTQMRASATQLLTAKKISSADAANVLKQTDAATEGISLARQMVSSDPAGANTKLQSAVAVLQVLQTYLASKGAPMNSLALVSLVLGLVDRAAQIGALINTARAEGRDVTDAELDALVAADVSVRQQLTDAIAAAKAEGR